MVFIATVVTGDIIQLKHTFKSEMERSEFTDLMHLYKTAQMKEFSLRITKEHFNKTTEEGSPKLLDPVFLRRSYT
jgi:hypothetical protein